MKNKLFALFFVIVALLTASSIPASASGTDSYTHWDLSFNNKRAVFTRPVYDIATVVNTRSLGIEESITINDITCDNEGNLYILTEESFIIIADEGYKLKKIMKITDENGDEADIMGAQGIYITDSHNILICDTSNNRLLICDKNGRITGEVTQPESPILPEDFNFIPTKACVDSKGFLYVISEGAYYGALLFNEKYEFLSFYGANTVNASVLSTLQNVWDMLTKSDEKRGNEMKKLPYQFIDLSVDENDFVYTCTGTASGGSESGQIRMLSPGGSNILDKNFGSTVIDAGSFNFTEQNIAKRRGQSVQQSLVGIGTDENGFIYGLDTVYGRIYTYDKDCNLLTVFGGGKDSGDRKGTFSSACAIEVSDKRVMVADNFLNQITVFKRTDYGNRVFKAQALVLDGEYLEAKPLWERILKEDQNNRLALSALGKAAYSTGNYAEAKSYAKLANDSSTYDQAMKKEQEIFISKYFLIISFIAVVIIGGLVYLVAISRKKNLVIIKNEKVRIMVTSGIHPFQNFNLIKYKAKGSVLIGIILSLLFFFSTLVKLIYTDFRFTLFDASEYNPAFSFVTTIGLIALWTFSNWAVSVVQEGKARLNEIFIVTSYAALPIIMYNFISTVLSHGITSTSIVFLNGLNIVALIITGIILTVGTMIIQEFSFPKFLVSAIITLLCMILIVFIIFMIGMLLSQFWQFIISIFMEVIYR